MIAKSAFDEDDIVPGGKTSQWYQGYIKGMADAVRMERASRNQPNRPYANPPYIMNTTIGQSSDVEGWHGKSEQFR